MPQPSRQSKQSKRLGAVNNYLLFRIEETGVEIKKSNKEDSRVRVSRENPLEKMRDDGKLTRQECGAGKNYQKRFTDANKDGYAKPSLLFDGLPDSARSTKPFEPTPSDERSDASKFIKKCYDKIAAASAPRQISGFKDFKKPGARKFSRDLRYIEIVQTIFEQEIAVRNVEKLTGMNHSIIEDRVKEICEILLTIKEYENKSKF